MISPYRVQPNNTNKRLKKHTNTNFDNNPPSKHDVKRPPMTPNAIKRPQSISESYLEVKPGKSKNRVKGANIEINDDY